MQNKSYLNIMTLPRGLRNNNVGNLIKTSIKWQGKVNNPVENHFESFSDIYCGIRAMVKDLLNDINKGKNTVSKLINEYAPKSENNTQAYIDAVCRKTGFKPNQIITVLTPEQLLLFVRAVITHENGNIDAYVTDNDIRQALTLLGTVKLSNLTFVYKKSISALSIIIPVILFFYTYITLTL